MRRPWSRRAGPYIIYAIGDGAYITISLTNLEIQNRQRDAFEPRNGLTPVKTGCYVHETKIQCKTNDTDRMVV